MLENCAMAVSKALRAPARSPLLAIARPERRLWAAAAVAERQFLAACQQLAHGNRRLRRGGIGEHSAEEFR